MKTREWLPLAACFFAGASAASWGFWLWRQQQNEQQQQNGLPAVAEDIVACIGHTPMVYIPSLSQATGCRILAKLELLNPGGSAKDRVARAVVDAAERNGQLRRGRRDAVYEGTSGSTGISLALICCARGYDAHVVLPDDTSAEKVKLLQALGAQVHPVRPAGIADSDHYVNVARRLAAEHESRCLDGTRGVFANQFENNANWQAHYETTGPEIWKQCGGEIDAFVTGAGTGGTMAGVARYLKERTGVRKVLAVIADPPGSGLYHRVKHGVMFSLTEREGKRSRHQVDTIVEGIGSNRMTANIAQALPFVDDAVQVSDAEALEMARQLSSMDGLFVGSSSAVNCVAAQVVARTLGPGHTIVTVLCDSGTRHMSKFWKV